MVAEVESFLLAPVIVAHSDLVLTAPRSALLSTGPGLATKVVPAPFALPALKLAAYWDPSRNDDARVHWILESIRQSMAQLVPPRA